MRDRLRSVLTMLCAANPTPARSECAWDVHLVVVLPCHLSNMSVVHRAPTRRCVLLLDPMVATGGSAIKAIEVLIEKGVPESQIYFLNIISCPEGLDAMAKACVPPR